MIVAERLRRIGGLLRSERVISTKELSERFGVSQMTIRRDLARLEHMGVCRLTHGGALAIGSPLVPDLPYQRRAELFVAEKRAIALCAATLVEDGETIAIDGGTTTRHLAIALRDRKDITIVTNSLPVLNELYEAHDLTVISTGGVMSIASYEVPGHADPCLVGAVAERTMRCFRPSKAFMATTSLNLADGLSNALMEQASMKLAMIEVSSEVILLADSSKFGQVSASIVGPVSLVNRVITDTGITPELRHALESIGIKVITVEPGRNESNGPL